MAAGQHPDAAIFRKLGEWLIMGTGVKQDFVAVRAWLEKAADAAASEGASSFVAEIDELLARIDVSTTSGKGLNAERSGTHT